MELVLYRRPHRPRVQVRAARRSGTGDLAAASQHGWEILNPRAFLVVWNGGSSREDLKFTYLDGESAGLAWSHFGHGVLSFELPIIFRTAPGLGLWLGGPVNDPKDAIYPLTGMVETDWSSYTITMNWIVTRPRVIIRFEAGEPFCFFFPVPRDLIERVHPEIVLQEPVATAPRRRVSLHVRGFSR